MFSSLKKTGWNYAFDVANFILLFPNFKWPYGRFVNKDLLLLSSQNGRMATFLGQLSISLQ